MTPQAKITITPPSPKLRVIAANTFDAILPPDRISTMTTLDAQAVAKKRSLLAKSTSKLGPAMKSALVNAKDVKSGIGGKIAEAKSKREVKKAEKKEGKDKKKEEGDRRMGV